METSKVGEELIKEGAPRITEKDIVKVVDKSEDIQKKFRSRGPCSASLKMGACWSRWSRTTWPAIIEGALRGRRRHRLHADLRFQSDWIVPDVLPFVGEIDDAAVVTACLFLVERDLLAYKQWKDSQPTAPS